MSFMGGPPIQQPDLLSSIGTGIGDSLKKGVDNAVGSAKSFLGSLFGNSGEPETPSTFINDYLVNMRINGWQRSNRFGIFFSNGIRAIGPGQTDLTDYEHMGTYLNNDRLNYALQSVTVPKKSFDTNDRIIAGPVRKMPYNAVFDDGVEMVFNVDPTFYQYNFFRRWQNVIVNEITREVSYYSDYAQRLDMTIFIIPNFITSMQEVVSKANSGKIFGMKLTEPYPKAVAMAQNAREQDTIQQMTVSLMFRECTTLTDNPQLGAEYQAMVESMFTPVDQNNNPLSGLNKIVNFGVNTSAMIQTAIR